MPHIDDLARMAFHPATPRDERWDANAELFHTFVSELSYPNIDEVRADVAQLLATPAVMDKAVRLEPYWATAGRTADYFDRGRGARPGDHNAILYLNEYGIVEPRDGKSRWLDKRSNSGFQFLRDVVTNVDLIAAVILTRQRQVRPFLRPERDKSPFGYHWVRADGEKITDADKPALLRLEEMLINSGDVSDYDKRTKLYRSDFDGFVTKLVWDSLAGDACPVELTYTNGGKLSGWHNVDFTTVRLTTETGYEGDDTIRAVQVLDDQAWVAFTHRDLLYEVRNPRTDLLVGEYGFAEPEMVIRAMTGYLNAITYNSAGIDRSAIPRGILAVAGDYSPSNLLDFKRSLKTMLTGAGQRHAIPIMAMQTSAQGGARVPVSWVPMDQFNEMFFARWITFLVAIICGVFGIDPGEIHFDSFSTRTSALGGKAELGEKLSLSRDKGLVPLVAFVEKVINLIVAKITPKYRLEFVGLQEEDAQQKQERARMASTVAEVRAIDGLDPIGNPILDNAPVNPSLIPLYLQSLAAAGILPQEGAEGSGGPGDSGDEGETPGGPGGEDETESGRGDLEGGGQQDETGGQGVLGAPAAAEPRGAPGRPEARRRPAPPGAFGKGRQRERDRWLVQIDHGLSREDLA